MRAVFLIILNLSWFSATFADTMDGRIASVDAENRVVTLEGGETMHLAELISLDGLVIGQLLRLEYESGTLDATSLLVLEEAPPIQISEEPILEEE